MESESGFYHNLIHIPFCLLLKFTDEQNARYCLHIGVYRDIVFEPQEGSIIGHANCAAPGFPLEYQIHPSLRLTAHQKAICEQLIHSGLAFRQPQIIHATYDGHNILFPPGPPNYVTRMSMEAVMRFTYLWEESPGSPLKTRTDNPA